MMQQVAADMSFLARVSLRVRGGLGALVRPPRRALGALPGPGFLLLIGVGLLMLLARIGTSPPPDLIEE